MHVNPRTDQAQMTYGFQAMTNGTVQAIVTGLVQATMTGQGPSYDVCLMEHFLLNRHYWQIMLIVQITDDLSYLIQCLVKFHLLLTQMNKPFWNTIQIYLEPQLKAKLKVQQKKPTVIWRIPNNQFSFTKKNRDTF